MKAKKLLAILLTICMMVSVFPAAFAADEADAFSVAGAEDVSTINITVDGKATTVTRYNDHYYSEAEENILTVGPGKYGPKGDRDDCQLSIYVPADADENSAVMFLIENGSWAQSGFKEVIAEGQAFDSTQNDRIALALARNMIVVSYGARCRGSVDKATGEIHIHAPQMIADTKAAIRYVKYNIELGTIPGDADKVIISGHSGGGALGSIIAATGNSSDFDAYLVNAAPATDDVYAVMASAPITDLAYADFAYEWTFGAYRDEAPYDKLSYGEYDDEMKALSATLAEKYVTYVADMFGYSEEEYIAKIAEIFAESVQHEIDLDAAFQYSDIRPETDDRGFFTLDDKGNVASFDLEAYTAWAVQNAGITDAYKGNELKGIMAFNSEGMKNGYNRNENNLWGTAEQAYSIAYPELWTMVKDPAAIGVDGYKSWDEFWAAEGENVAMQMKSVSVMPYLTGSENMWYLEGLDASGDDVDVAPNWFIRHGMGDIDTSYATVASLMIAVEEKAENVSAYFGWERGHNGGGNTYYLEFFQWLEDEGLLEAKAPAADPLSIAAASKTELTPKLDGKDIKVTKYEAVYCANSNSAEQKLALFVPENATADSPIIYMVDNSGWRSDAYADVQNKVASFGTEVQQLPPFMGGGTQEVEVGNYVSGSDTDAVGECLANGYVILVAGLRSRADGLTGEEYLGHSPATMVDAKAVIRYIKYNADALPAGDADKIVITGTSGGGALSVVTAGSGNSEDYYAGLYEIGAAGITKAADGSYVDTLSDDIYATIAYCPITDLGNACAAYEWQWAEAREALIASGADLGSGFGVPVYPTEDVRAEATKILTANYEEYLDSLGLESVSAKNLEATIIALIKAEIDEAIKEVGIEKMKADLGDATWLKFNADGTYTYDYQAHLDWVGTQTAFKAPSAFSNVGMTAWAGNMNEDDLFGTRSDAYSPFNEYAWNNDDTENAVGKDDTGLTWDEYMATDAGKYLALQIKKTSPIEYLLDAEDGDSAPYWYVRYGLADRDSSFAVEAVLNAAMEADASIKDVDFEYAWLEGHGGNYDVQEAYAWLKAKLAGEAETGYADVAEGAWYYDAIMAATEAGLMNGVSATEFAPKATITRAMLATILYRMAGEPAVEKAAEFKDVPAGKWYSDAIAWAAAEEIVKGYGDGLFGTNEAVTREQFVTMLYRYAQFKGEAKGEGADLSKFTDAKSISTWAADAVAWATEEGIIQGNPDGSFNPKGTASRAEAAVMFARF